MWTVTDPDYRTSPAGSLAAADIDGDGQIEIVVPSSTGELMAFEHNGDPKWRAAVATGGWAGAAIANLDGVGLPEIIVGNTLLNADGSLRAQGTGYIGANGNNAILSLVADLDGDPARLLDLTTSRLRVIDPGAGQTASLEVRIGNAGAAPMEIPAEVVFYQGEPGAGGRLLGRVVVEQLAAGAYIDVVLDDVSGLDGMVDIHAIADHDDRIIECNETNNRMSLAIATQSGAGAIIVATDRPGYGPSAAVTLQASIVNTSALPGDYQAALRVEDLQGNALVAFDPVSVGPLAGNTAIALTQDWNTASYLAGSYRLRGVLHGEGGTVLDEQVSEFDIVHEEDTGPLLDLRVTPDRPAYHSSGTAQLDTLVRNLSLNTRVPEAELSLTVTAPDGRPLFQHDAALVELGVGSSRQALVAFPFIHLADGQYTIRAEVRDADGALLTTGQTGFEVRADPVQALHVQASADVPLRTPGDPQTCRYTVTHNGVQAIDALPLQRLWVHLDSGQAVVQDDLTLDLAAAASQSFSLGGDSPDRGRLRLRVAGLCRRRLGDPGRCWVPGRGPAGHHRCRTEPRRPRPGAGADRPRAPAVSASSPPDPERAAGAECQHRGECRGQPDRPQRRAHGQRVCSPGRRRGRRTER